jgi:3',5'-cyclic AMP phosphodiesterase CpdA
MTHAILLWFLLQAVFAQTVPFDPPRGDVRAVILSDINSAYGSTSYTPGIMNAVQTILEVWRPDLVLSPGDLVAGQSAALPDQRFAEMWAAFDDSIARPLREAGIPFGVALGNHDASSSRRADGRFAFEREREAAAAYWREAEHDPGLAFVDHEDFPFHYTFTLNGVFVLVWDASSAYIPESRLDWARRSLASPAAQNARLRLVIGHLPLFGVAQGRNQPGEVLRGGDALREMLESYRVHSYISGHHHAYYPAKRGDLYLLSSGGVGPRRLLGSQEPPRTTVTVMDIDFTAATPAIRYTTYDLASHEVIDIRNLPESIDGLNGRIVRMDLAE